MSKYLKYIVMAVYICLKSSYSTGIDDTAVQSFSTSPASISMYTINSKIQPELYNIIKLTKFTNSNDPKKFEAITSHYWPCINRIVLTDITITADMMKAMIKSGFTRANFILIYNFKIESDALDIMVLEKWPNLKRLEIKGFSPDSENCFLTPHTFETLCQRFAPQLEYLAIYNWRTVDQADVQGCDNACEKRKEKSIAMLAFFNRSWPKLKKLMLGYCDITDQAVTHLHKDNFPKLKKLNLQNNDLGDEGVKAIVVNLLPQLTKLNLLHNTISSEMITFLNEYVKHINWPGFPWMASKELQGILFEIDNLKKMEEKYGWKLGKIKNR